MHRFHVPALAPSGEQRLTGDLAHRIARVLRMPAGERVRLFDGSGREVVAVLAGVTAQAVSVRLLDELLPAPPEPRLHLYQALIRPNRFDWLLEKATELGATTLTPVVSERVQVRRSELGPSRAARWARIIVEACEQCGRRTLPELRDPRSFSEALAEASGVIVLAWETARGDAPALGTALRNLQRDGVDAAADGAEVSLFIGPEGGFAVAEVAAARERGVVVVSLGPRILRAETAALAALAVAADALEAAPSPAEANDVGSPAC